MWWWHMEPGAWSWGWAPGGWVMTVAFWAILIFLGVWAVRSLIRPTSPPSGPSHRSPLDIAKERYARGEISREEYEEIRRTLGG